MTKPGLPTYDALPNETTEEEIVELLSSKGFLTDDAIKYRIFDENPVDAINEYCAEHGKVFRDPWFQYLQYDEPIQWTKDLNGEGQHGADESKEAEDVHHLEWARPLQINPDMVMFKDGVMVSDAYQGGIGNCGVCAMNTAIQCLQPEPIRRNLYPSEISERGCYSWKTFRNGKFGYVLFDDLIACIKDSNSPWSWHTTDNLEAWPMFLEKSMAKTNGTYNPWPANGWNRCWDFPRPVMMDAGFVYHVEEHFKLHNEDDWPFMVDHLGKNVIAAEQFKNAAGTGLVEKHGYACLGAAVVGDLHLLKWRNPWGCAEWTGDWSDGSPLWEDLPDVKAACEGSRIDSTDGDRGRDDGAFWMERKDLDRHMYADYLHMIVLCEETGGYQNSSRIGTMVTGPEGSDQVCVKIKHSGGDLLWGAECFDARWTCDDLKLYCDLFHLLENKRQAEPFYSTRGMNRDMGRQDTDHRIYLGGEHLEGGDILMVFGWEVTGECPPAEGESKQFYVRVSSCDRPHELGEMESYESFREEVTSLRFATETDKVKLTGQERKNWKIAELTPDDRLVVMANAVEKSENFETQPHQGDCFCMCKGTPGFAEYTLGINPGFYAVYAHYTSADPRPLTISIDGEEVGQIATEAIGDFGGETMKWSLAQGVTVPECDSEQHTLRLETQGFYPHISAVAFVKVEPDFDFEAGASAMLLGRSADDADPERPPSFWADEAFQLRGSDEDYKLVMSHPEQDREGVFKRLESGTYWADEAFQMGSQEDYDAVMNAPEEEREARYKERRHVALALDKEESQLIQEEQLARDQAVSQVVQEEQLQKSKGACAIL